MSNFTVEEIDETTDYVVQDVLDQVIDEIEVVEMGPKGDAGPGVPVGGTTGQFLKKNSGTNYDTLWADVNSAIWGNITGTLSNQTDLQAALDAKEPLLPSQTENAGKFLSTNGTVKSWQTITAPVWGAITGTLSNQTDLQTALNAKLTANSSITGATKTKITYDSKGLVTAGADAGISDITGLQAALDGFVPYTGATSSVNLGIFSLTAGDIIGSAISNQLLSLVIDLDNYKILDNFGVDFLDIQNRFILDANEVTFLDAANRWVYNPSGVIVADFSSLALADSSGVVSVNFGPRSLCDTTGSPVLDYSYSAGSILAGNFNPITNSSFKLGDVSFSWLDANILSLNDSSGALSFSPNLREFYDSFGVISGNYSNRTFSNSSSQITLDYQSQFLSPDGTIQVLNWSTQEVKDISDVLSQSWTLREWYDSAGILSGSYALRIFYDGSAIASHDYGQREFYDSAQVLSIGYEARTEYDQNGVASHDFNNRKFYRTTAIESLDYQNSILRDSSAVTSLHYGSRGLYSSSGTLLFGWTSSLSSTVPYYAPISSAAAPAFSFTGDSNTGMYSSAADTINFAVNGSSVLSITNGASQLNTSLKATANRFYCSSNGSVGDSAFAGSIAGNGMYFLSSGTIVAFQTASTERMTINAAGMMTVNNATNSSSATFTKTHNSTNFLANTNFNTTASSGTNLNQYGLYSFYQIAATGSLSGTNSMGSYTQMRKTGGFLGGNVYAYNAAVNHFTTSSTLTNVFLYNGEYTSENSTNSTTNVFGYRLAPYTGTASSTVTNFYGVHLGSLKGTGVTNAYGVYQDGANDINYFNGNTGIGINAPTAKLDVAGTVKLGTAGTILTNIISATATLDFPSIPSNSTSELTITVTGAQVGASVVLGAPAGLEAGLISDGRVSATNTVTVRLHNSSGGSIDPASATWRATVINF